MWFFGKKQKQDSIDNVIVSEENPYLAGRREWNERYGDQIQNANNWRLIAFFCAFIATIAVCGVVYIGSKNKLVPYVVEVDSLGQALAVGRADNVGAKDVRIIKYELGEFINNFRTLYTDVDMQKKHIRRAYRYVMPKSEAFNVITDFYRTHSPFDAIKTERRNVEILSVFNIQKNNWQIDWVERISTSMGETIGAEYYRAIVTIDFIEPQTEEAILANPIGMWITKISWSKINQTGAQQ